MRIVSQAIPSGNNKGYERGLQEAQQGLERAIAAQLAADVSFAEREEAVLAAANEMCRRLLEAALQATADGHPDRVRIEGIAYARHQEGAVTYHSLCGPLTVRRATYREVGEHNGPTVVALDLAAGLIEGATPALAYRVALGYAQGPGRHAEEQMHADHRQPPSRSTLERLAKAIGTAVTRSGAPGRTACARGRDAAGRGPGRLGRHRSDDRADGRRTPGGHPARHAAHAPHGTLCPRGAAPGGCEVPHGVCGDRQYRRCQR